MNLHQLLSKPGYIYAVIAIVLKAQLETKPAVITTEIESPPGAAGKHPAWKRRL